MQSTYDSPRTICELHKEMMEADPKCGLTLCALRRLCRSGQVRSVRVGNKYLVTHKAVQDYLHGQTVIPSTDTTHGIRRIDWVERR